MHEKISQRSSLILLPHYIKLILTYRMSFFRFGPCLIIGIGVSLHRNEKLLNGKPVLPTSLISSAKQERPSPGRHCRTVAQIFSD
jgi:hypothetical protein